MDDYFVSLPPPEEQEPADGLQPLPPGAGVAPPPSGVPLLQLLGVLTVALVVAVGGVVLLVRATAGGDPAAAPVAQQTDAPQMPTTAAPLSEDGFRVWARRTDGTPVRWDPCTPVSWVLNPDGAPPNAMADLRAAFARVSAASGLAFRFEGMTDEVPDPRRPPFQPERYGSERWAPVLVAWVDTSDTLMPLLPTDAGVAIPVTVSAGGAHSFVTAQVVLDTSDTLEPGFGDRATSWGSVLQHEIAHVVGLDHVDDPSQLMFPSAQPGLSNFGAGDLAGLRALGAGGGCVETPTPQPVDVGFDHG
jgi:hypothetical protein